MDKYERVIEMAKRRGFLWPSFEIYGAIAGFWDFGPLGTILKRRIENLWRDFYVIGEGFYEMEGPTIGIEDVFIASGHVDGFVDLMVECKKCGGTFRADHLIQETMGAVELTEDGIKKMIKKHKIGCPECGGVLGDPYAFNLMFKTAIGPGSKRIGYLRPETAQNIFTDFGRLLRFYRDKLPFGVAQIGKAYRNEISPRQGVVRLREFTQAEAEIFVHPNEKHHPRFGSVADTVLRLYSEEEQDGGDVIEIAVGEAVEKGTIAHQFLGYHIVLVQSFLTEVGIPLDRLRFRQHRADERAHYAVDCWDAETLTDRFGWIELVGIADRTDYDLKSHSKQTHADMEVFISYDRPKTVERLVIKPNMGILGPKFKDMATKIADILKTLSIDQLGGEEITIHLDGKAIRIDPGWIEYSRVTEEVHGEYVVPHAIEPSYGIDRIVYALLEHSFDEEGVEGGEVRIVLRIPPKIAPVQVAVFPLLTKSDLIGCARGVESLLRQNKLMVEYDESGTIGRRYRRHDEIGTPLAVTIDHQTLEDNTVTIRDRDSMRQVRVKIDGVVEIVCGLLSGDVPFEGAGALI